SSSRLNGHRLSGCRAGRGTKGTRKRRSSEVNDQANGLTGQRVLVTDGTSSIGRAVALQLAREGAEVLVHGRDAARGTETVQEITASGGKASFVAADLRDAADVQRLASDVGDVDILINNAGISLFRPTAEVDVAAFDKMF